MCGVFWQCQRCREFCRKREGVLVGIMWFHSDLLCVYQITAKFAFRPAIQHFSTSSDDLSLHLTPISCYTCVFFAVLLGRAQGPVYLSGLSDSLIACHSSSVDRISCSSESLPCVSSRLFLSQCLSLDKLRAYPVTEILLQIIPLLGVELRVRCGGSGF